MPKSSRKNSILFGGSISAFVLLIISIQTNHVLIERRSSASSSPNNFGDDYGSTESSDESLMRSTKSKRIRPSAEELAKKLLESRQIKLVRKLQMMKDGGLDERHPSMKAPLEELAKNPDIRTELQNGRTYVLWTRDTTEDGFQLNQYQFEVGGAISLKTVHRLDPNGSALKSKIFDDKNNEIFKVSYGYRRADGMLVEERVFDSRDRLLDPQGIEIPIRRIVHGINAADGSLEWKVVDLEPSSLPLQMDMAFKNPFLQQ